MKFSVFRSSLILGAIALYSFSSAIVGQDIPEIVQDIPKKVPIDVQIIKPEKLEDYPENIKVRIRNVSDKPIFSLRIRIYLVTDTPVISPWGEPTFPSIPLTFGRYELNTGSGGRPDENDPKIKPGEYHTFTLPKGEITSFRNAKSRGTFQQPLHYRVAFSDLSFGDGSGFTRGGIPFNPN